MSAVVAAGTTAAGRTRVTTRALTRVVSAVAADALDVDPGRVRVDLDDHGGDLAVTVHSPIGLPALSSLEDDRPTSTLLERCSQAQDAIKDRIPAMTGYRIASVSVHVTGANVVTPRRVE